MTEPEYTNPYDDPLYLSSSDFPGVQLVSTLLNGRNYLSWNRAIVLALGSKNKQGFLDGTTAKPDSTSAKLKQWIRSDNMVRCWLLNSIEGNIKEGFFSAKSSKTLWNEIQERYGQSNGPLLFQLKKELRNKDGRDSKEYRKFKPEERVCHHCNKKGHVKDRCFKLHPELLQQMQQQRTKMQTGNTKFSVNQVESDLYADTPVDFASSSDGPRKFDPALVSALYQEMMRMASGASLQNFFHNNTDSAVNFAGNNAKAKVFTCMTPKNGHESHWIVDSGATDHMTFCRHLFVSWKTLDKPVSVGLPDGSVKTVTIVGDVKLLANTGHDMLFNATTCVLQDHVTKHLVAEGHREDGLYKFHFPDFISSVVQSDAQNNVVSPFNACSAVNTCKQQTLDLLHARLGHSSLAKMKHINVVNCSGVNAYKCDTCIQAKMHMLPFPRSNNKALHIFDLIHIDLWGPFKIPSLSGAHYFLTIVDDCSRVTWTFLVKYKTQVGSVIEGFMNQVET
ncbi:hypothetical protein RND81_02G085000 [Saponaria officinalis]|uniref:Uncharacterized protein n=1 Tax=Saponaria officinalis TaxID=3572 RepID=A0AAW1MRE0_SAPOF